MAANIERLLKEIRSLSPTEKIELAQRLNEEAIFNDQSWYWTPEWQAAEKEADEDISAGRISRFKNVNNAIKFLHEQADQANGD